jgi:hypothetical protein
MGAKTSNKKPFANPLELLRDMSRTTADSVKSDLLTPMPEEIARQIFGRMPRREKKYSGEIMPGEVIEMKEVYSGKAEENEKLKKTVYLERRLRQEDHVLVERKTQELRLQIKAIHDEVEKVAKITPQLANEVRVAAFQAPSSTSIYELYFLERIFEFIKSFRKKIENANVWLMSANRKAAKKNRWGQNYKKSGAKYLLSSEHYLQRSAG